jgi:hypothetical protein
LNLDRIVSTEQFAQQQGQLETYEEALDLMLGLMNQEVHQARPTVRPEYTMENVMSLCGEWKGYYLYQTAQMFMPNPAIDEMMVIPEMQFRLGPAHAMAQSQGRDQHGPFSLTLGWNLTSKRVECIKAYVTHSFRYGGWMTPCGIVGCWGFAGFGGWFWLFKT